MKVKAIQIGHYGGRIREPGAIFELVPYKRKNPETGKEETISAEKQFSKSWMKQLTEKESKKQQEKQEELDQESGESPGEI